MRNHLYSDEIHENRENRATFRENEEGKYLLKSHGGNYVSYSQMHETWNGIKKKKTYDSNAKNTNIQATQIYLIKYLRNFRKNLDWIGARTRWKKSVDGDDEQQQQQQQCQIKSKRQQ